MYVRTGEGFGFASRRAQRTAHFPGEAVGRFLGRGETDVSFSPSCDRAAATPAFPASERRKLTGLLSPSQSAAAIRWNLRTHPASSGVPTAHIATDLTRYVDFEAVREAVRTQSGVLSTSSKEIIDSVFVEAAHQFQAKVYRDKNEQKGEVGPSTLESLGIVKHNLRVKFGDVYGRKVLKKILPETFDKLTGGEFNADNWYDSIVAPSFLGHRVSRSGQGIHLLLLRKLREAENYLRSLPAYTDMPPVALGRALGLDRNSASYSGGRISAKREGMHGMGLALDIDGTGNPWVGAGWITDDPKGRDWLVQQIKTNPDDRLRSRYQRILNTRNERYRFAQVLRSAAGESRDVPAEGSTIASFLHAVAVAHGRDTRTVYQILARRNEEFKAFLRSHPSELDYWKNSATFSNRNPLHGFLNLHVDLVVALRHRALLAWGATDFGGSQSGDVMHFDVRTLGVGREIANALGSYVPRSGHHPVSGAAPSVFPSPSPPGASRPSVASSIAALPKILADGIRSGGLTLHAVSRILAGERDVNTLTNLIFYARHPDLPLGHKIQPHEKVLAQEWLNIRERGVRPVLRAMTP
jgi:hypothetical protein